MSRWKALPESLDLRVRQLVVHMRQLKDHSGLSLAALASRTSYSRSSWARYLNGRALPPRRAVEAMADACGGDRVALSVLWEVAASAAALPVEEGPEAADGEQAPDVERAPDGDPASDGETVAVRRDLGSAVRHVPARASVVAVAAAVAVLVAAAGALAVVRPWEQGAQERVRPAKAAVPTSTYSAKTFPCHFTVRDGLLYAGHSTTLTDQYAVGTTVEAVAEVQCLVLEHGFDPQGVDASFGPNTRAAVRAFQRARGLDDDGVVGPKTWRELRKPTARG
ncbi:helix-turn-helix domain-containing protein [Streptomyces sp. NPDC060194]|uniref:helix-turn-helix domain-containing protein n=1 Tax=Streptomyces sp. NPDC060194 TaxID=3347069 RepID=UPI003649E8E6